MQYHNHLSRATRKYNCRHKNIQPSTPRIQKLNSNHTSEFRDLCYLHFVVHPRPWIQFDVLHELSGIHCTSLENVVISSYPYAENYSAPDYLPHPHEMPKRSLVISMNDKEASHNCLATEHDKNNSLLWEIITWFKTFSFERSPHYIHILGSGLDNLTVRNFEV